MKSISILATVGLLIYSANVAAWSKAIWPFNTPYMVAKQICTNSEDWARSAVQSRSYNGQQELLQELRNIQVLEIQNDPKYRPWHNIYYTEMTQFVRLVWKNPNVSEEMAAEIVRKDCASRINVIQKRLEESDPS